MRFQRKGKRDEMSVLILCLLLGISEVAAASLSRLTVDVPTDISKKIFNYHPVNIPWESVRVSDTTVPVRLLRRSASRSVTNSSDLSTVLRPGTTDRHPVHVENASFQLAVFDAIYILDVTLNSVLIPANYTQSYFTPSGQTKSLKGTERCYYHGNVRGRADSGVALSTCRGLRGMFRVGGITFLIRPLDPKTVGPTTHIVFRVSPSNGKATSSSEHSLLFVPRRAEVRLSGRRKVVTNKNKRFIELMVVNDYSMYRRYGQTLDGVNEYVTSAVNIVDELYKTQLNTRIILVATETWTSGDQITLTRDLGETRDNFQAYRGGRIVGQIRHDTAHLVTAASFYSGTSDRAEQAGLSSESGSVGVTRDVDSGNPVALAVRLAQDIEQTIGIRRDDGRLNIRTAQLPQPDKSSHLKEDATNGAKNSLLFTTRRESASTRKLLQIHTDSDNEMESATTGNSSGISANTTRSNLTTEVPPDSPRQHTERGNTGKTTSGGSSLGTNTIIGAVIGSLFLVAILFGATSIGFKRVKRNSRRSWMQTRPGQHPYIVGIGGRPLGPHSPGGKPRPYKHARQNDFHAISSPNTDVKTSKPAHSFIAPKSHGRVVTGHTTPLTSKVTSAVHSADTPV